jgi:hypothetical protein
MQQCWTASAWLADNNVNKQNSFERNNGRTLLWFSNFYRYNSRVWRSVGCRRVYLAADSFEVGRLSSYRKLWEEHMSLYGGRWRHSIVGDGKWRVNGVYAEVPLWSASGPIARRWIVPMCVWKPSDCKNGSECWKIATRGPVGRIL